LSQLTIASVWNNIYLRNKQMSVWPWSDLISIVMRYSKPTTDDFKVLELGCGAGANIPFFVSMGVDYYSIEASDVIVSRLHKNFPELANKIFAGDFTKTLPNEKFDLIFDRGALANNKTDLIKECLEHCYERLKFSGKFIGVDWYSTKTSSYDQGEFEDEWVRTNFPTGPFVDVDRLHFTNKKHLYDLFSKFEIQHLEHKTVEYEFNIDHPIVASWNFVAIKK